MRELYKHLKPDDPKFMNPVCGIIGAMDTTDDPNQVTCPNCIAAMETGQPHENAYLDWSGLWPWCE
jgi:hypothetical protein